jgi:hypothetical protein
MDFKDNVASSFERGQPVTWRVVLSVRPHNLDIAHRPTSAIILQKLSQHVITSKRVDTMERRKEAHVNEQYTNNIRKLTAQLADQLLTCRVAHILPL